MNFIVPLMFFNLLDLIRYITLLKNSLINEHRWNLLE